MYSEMKDSRGTRIAVYNCGKDMIVAFHINGVSRSTTYENSGDLQKLIDILGEAKNKMQSVKRNGVHEKPKYYIRTITNTPHNSIRRTGKVNVKRQ